MKKIFLTTIMLGAATLTQAQDTYLNDRLTNNAGDVYGTARYVGMGGAMGALGADISTISWNPAGIGLMRKNDVAITFGGIWDKNGINEESKAHGTLDQMGIVYVINTDGDTKVRNVNVGFNYQKKINYNNAFYADHNNLNGASQMNQLCDLANAGYDSDHNLAGMAVDYNYLTPVYQSDGETIDHYVNNYVSEINRYTQHTSGSLQSFDFNISGNVNDRGYWGLTLGFDNMRYRAWTDYYEECFHNSNPSVYGDYSVYNDYSINGYGFSVKAGAIVRPIEDNPLRVGLVVETPTWYQLKSSTLYQMTDQVDGTKTSCPESYLEYAVRTPWKLRLGIGSTVSNYLAWDIDYEYANYSMTKMGYPNSDIDDPRGSLFSNTWDISMNNQTKDNLKATHNVRAGIEYKPTKNWALRLGYNYATSAYKKDCIFDQYELNSYAMNYSTSTSYMRLSDSNTLTLGAGYKGKYIYVDLAYKLRSQKADFYGFDSSKLTPVKDVDLTKHQLTATLGVKF